MSQIFQTALNLGKTKRINKQYILQYEEKK